MSKDIVFVKIKSEIAAGTRGSSMGVEAMEVAAINDKNTLFKDVESVLLPDENHLLHESIQTPNAIRVRGLVKVLDVLMNGVKDQLVKGRFPIVLSGDHSNAAGTIAGIKKAHPNKRLGVVWVDAHGDLHTPYTTPSGNMHGMPVAMSLGEDNLENKINDLNQEELESWNQLKNLGGIQPKILAEDLVFFSVRSTETPEDNLAIKHGIKNYSVGELRYKGMDKCLQEADDRLKNCDLIYISFDVDSMDCDLISYGTGTPVQKGLDQNEALEILTHFYTQDKCASIEFVEINPLLDNKGNKMAETAFEVLKSLVNLK
ncbi:MAG: arginase [Salibacteraceae bacterium]